MAKLSAYAKQVRAEREAAERAAAAMANMTEREIIHQIDLCEHNIADWQTSSSANNDRLRARIDGLRAELTSRRQAQTLEAAPEAADTTPVTVVTKLYQGDTWSTEPARTVTTPEHAAIVLSKFSAVYGAPESIAAGTKRAKFWFRADGDCNLLIVVDGASLANLRSAYVQAVSA